METLPAITVEHLYIGLGRDRLLIHDLNFSVAPRKCLAIVGESGWGKTLLALTLTGLLPEAANWAGTIHLHGAAISPETAQRFWQDLRGKVVSIVFQESATALNPTMAVGKQLAESIYAGGRETWSASKVAAREWMRKVQMPEQSFQQYPHQLSAAQKLRVIIAMAASSNPALLIVDEPTTGLDAIEQKDILQLLQSIRQEHNTALIFLTHDLVLAAKIADDILVLRNGLMQEYGPTEQILQKTTSLQPFRQPPILTEPGPAGQPSSSDVLLKVRHLRVWFPAESDWLGIPLRFLRAVEDVSFDLYRGEILGLIGQSGSGKSTLVRALAGLQEVESGQMLFDGRDLVHMSPGEWRSIRREVQILFADASASLNPSLTIEASITEPMLVHGVVPKGELRKEALRLLALVHLPENVLALRPQQLSQSQLTRIAIARALSLRPKLLICDDCLRSLDISAQAAILTLIKELQSAQKLSCLFISSKLNAVHHIADRAIVMHAGKIIERGTAEEVFKNPRQPYTNKLIEAMM